MDTSYVAGTGLLLTRSRRWLLLDDDPPRDRVEEWWDLLGTAGPVRDKLVAALEVAYPLHEVSLVLVDLDDATTTLTWGNGRVDADAGGQRLSVGLAGEGKALPLLAGVVPAATVEVRTASFGGAGTLIDGIPADILESSSSSPPPTRPMFRPADASSRDEEVEITVPRRVSDVLGDPSFAADTAEPVTTSELSDHLRQSSQETVLAVQCPHGHVTPAYTPTCRVCNAAVEPQEPRSIPRPNLGGLRLPSGELVPLDRGVVFGRKPTPVPGSSDWPHLVHLPQDSTYVSRMHLQIELDGWLVLARDLGSRGGTTLRIPGRLPQRIRANERYVLEPGHALDLADTYEITYEVSS
ncbi:FHA domain-containing protein [Nocardioides sp.]|uniref:FHA domain-containing protein n=1 Tax=Nocardioides sp. TaxID=35761 RepID=UPI0035298389